MKKLTDTQTAEFYRIWYGLLSHVNKNKRICPEAQDDLDDLNYQTNDVSLIHPIRNFLWEHPKLIASYTKSAGDDLSERERSILADWQKYYIKGRFAILRNIAKYTVFMHFDEKKETLLYGVTGALNPVSNIFPTEKLPALVEAVLLPFDGIIIYDTIIESYSLSYGAGMVSAFEQFYIEERQKRGITETLIK